MGVCDGLALLHSGYIRISLLPWSFTVAALLKEVWLLSNKFNVCCLYVVNMVLLINWGYIQKQECHEQ